MAERPDWVAGFDRPRGTETRRMRGRWYLYERSYRYDPEIKRPRKVLGRCLGKITPEGLVPSASRAERAASAQAAEVSDVVEVDVDGLVLLVYCVVDPIAFDGTPANLPAHGLAHVEVDAEEPGVVGDEAKLLLVLVEQGSGGAGSLKRHGDVAYGGVKAGIRGVRDDNPIGHTCS